MKTAMSTAGGPLPLDALGSDVLPPGSMAGPWRVERELGRGGMGAVYAVVHDEIGKRAALKVVHRRLLTPAFNVERVMLEAKVVNTVGHPNIVDIFETGSLPDGRPYIVMERLEGQPLSSCADAGKILPDRVIAILLQCCDALIAAHAANVVHRDLKLDNVFLVDNAEDSQSPKVKVLDWGIAKVINCDVRHTIEGQLVGTPQYLSPEQARGANVTAQSDVYSLGVMAYELFLEQLPFEAETAAEVMVMHLKAIPPAPREMWPEIPGQLEELLLRMLAKQPENRPTMREVARHLEEVRAELHRRRQSMVGQSLEVIAIARPSTIIRPPSAGLAPTLQSDSGRWSPEPRTKRWQWAVGASALFLAALMFIVTRSGETREANAATNPTPPHGLATAEVRQPPQTIAAREQPTPRAGETTDVAPRAMPAATVTGELLRRPLSRTSPNRRPPTRKATATAAPRPAGAPIDPNGTIDPYR